VNFVVAFRRRIICAAVLALSALFSSCGGGDTIDGMTTEKVSLHTTADYGVSGLSAEEEKALLDKVRGFFGIYFGDVDFSISYDFSKRAEYGGDECFEFYGKADDESNEFIIAASVDGENFYGCDPKRGLVALIWCEGWTDPDFSFFGELDTSNL